MDGVGYGLVVPPKKSAPPAAAPSWDGRLAQKIGQRVAVYRKLRGITAQELSDRLAKMGVELKRTVIGNLESGYRRTVSAAEVLAIAYVLDVPPIALLVPLGADDEIEILKDTVVNTWSAARWITAEWNPERPDGVNGFPLPSAGDKSRAEELQRRDNAELVDRYRQHHDAVTEWKTLQFAMADSEAERDRVIERNELRQREIEGNLRILRGAMRVRDQLPPLLPPALARRLNEEGTVDGQPDD